MAEARQQQAILQQQQRDVGAVPTPVLELSSEQVLTMERFDGSRLVDATAGPDAGTSAATRVCGTYRKERGGVL